jgi:hypothetical protein
VADRAQCTGSGMLDGLDDAVELAAPSSKGKRQSSVAGFIETTKLAAGGLPLRRIPDWLRPIIGWLMPKIGPTGLEFARARVEIKAAETILRFLPTTLPTRHLTARAMSAAILCGLRGLKARYPQCW